MATPVTGHIASLWRHPVKGFTPEGLATASLAAGGFFPGDRLYAVENGPSGFDPAAPAWTPKQRFTVLAAIADVAKVRTAYDESTNVLTAQAEGWGEIRANLAEDQGRAHFADWLTPILGEDVRGPLKVVDAPGHRFTDHPKGFVSIVSLASVRDLEQRIGRPLDPLRFRANIYVEGWPAWIENSVGEGALRLGPVTFQGFSPIVRCIATHVDPSAGVRDIEVVPALHEHYGHLHCGLYVSITGSGQIAEGDAAVIATRSV